MFTAQRSPMESSRGSSRSLQRRSYRFFEIPNSAMRFVVIALAVGFPIAMLLSWLYEFTPAGIVRTEDVDPEKFLLTSSFELCSYVAFGLLKVTNDKKECTCLACLIRSRFEI